MVSPDLGGRLYLGFLGLLAAERLGELWLSRRNARLQFARGARESGQGHYGFMAGFHTAFLLACAAELLVFAPPVSPALALAALVAALLAQGLRYWAVTTLGARWNTRVIARPDEPPVVAGPYRYLRHPNYLAVVVELATVPLIHGCWRSALAFSLGNAGLLAVRIPAEERALGPGYAAAFDGRARFWPSRPGRGRG